MEAYDLKNLHLVTQGGEADIYSIANDKILRVIRNRKGKTFETEKHLFPILAEHHIKVPAVYEYIESEDMLAQVMQKVDGSTMLEQMQRNPLKLTQEIKKLAGMHAKLLEIQSDCGLHSIDTIFNYFTSKPSCLDNKLINFASKILKELPAKNNICHGDFHPGNILVQDHAYYIIDWSGAYRSDFISDIAHTYLLMAHVPEVPGQSHLQHAVISFLGSNMAKIYLKEIHKLKEFSLSDFSKWTVVMSLLRVYYGMPSERAVRINYLKKCCELNEKNIDTSIWYKYISK